MNGMSFQSQSLERGEGFNCFNARAKSKLLCDLWVNAASDRAALVYR